MCKYVFLLVALSFSTALTAQVYVSDNVSGNLYREQTDHDIAGTPFFREEWTPGVIYMKDGSKASKFLLRLDAYKNELLFLYEGKPLVVVNPVKEFILTPASGEQYHFRCGFPALDKYDESSFYQVLQDGPVALLKMNRKSIIEVAEYNKGSNNKEFSLNETYYISIDGRQPVRIRKDKSSLIAAIGDADGKLLAWVNKNGYKCRSEEEMMAVVKAFNEGTYK